MSSLQSIANLQDTQTLVSSETVSQGPGNFTTWSFSPQYAGYIVVHIQSSTTSNTKVIVTWISNNGISYYDEATVGYSGVAMFPVLPSSSATIYVGNSNLFSGATETVTITYTY